MRDRSESLSLELWDMPPLSPRSRTKKVSKPYAWRQGDLFSSNETVAASLTASAFAEQRPFSFLVIDDNDINRKVVGTILKELGYACLEASSGKEALLLLELNDAIDFLFTDIDMPEMNGIEMAQAIRKREAQSATPHCLEIVAITGNVSADIRLRCKRAGMNGFLQKPVTAEMIKEQLLRSWNRIRRKGRKPPQITGPRGGRSTPRLSLQADFFSSL